MDSRQLLESMSLIDDKYILSAERGHVTNKIKGRYVRMIGGIAACVCIAVGTVFCVTHLKNPSDPYVNPPEQTTGTDTPTVPESDFVIEDGVLIAYTGCETEVVVPDEVKVITDKSFSGKALAKTVTAIHLGAAVEQIDEKAFCNLTALESITVDENNPVFFSDKGVLGKRDGTLYYQPNKCIEDSYAFHEVIEEMQKKNDYFNDVTRISVGQAVIDLKFVDNGIKNCPRQCYMMSICAYGHEKLYDDPKSLSGNFHVYLIQSDDAFIMQFSNAGLARGFPGSGYTIIFTEDEVIELNNNNKQSEYYNVNPETNLLEPVSSIAFVYRDDGKIGYVRIPSHYHGIIFLSDVITNCVARDDFYRETGYAEIENGEIIYYPEKTFTVSDYYDLDECFQFLKENIDDLNEYNKFESLEELMEYNRKTYAKAK